MQQVLDRISLTSLKNVCIAIRAIDDGGFNLSAGGGG